MSGENIQPLTAKVSEDNSHIAWIEDSDPGRAFRRMYDALQASPVNVAVWANAGETADPDLICRLKELRPTCNLETPGGSGKWMADQAHSAEAISALFNHAALKAGREDIAEICARLDRHARERHAVLRDSLPFSDFAFNLRADRSAYTRENPDVHVDEPFYGNFRMLENLGCLGTCLITNDNAELIKIVPTEFMPVSGANDVRYKWRLKQDADAVFWQVPENSVTLFAGKLLPWQPILHAEAPTPAGSAPLPRTLLVHDFR